MKQQLFKNKKGVSNGTIAVLVIASLVISIVGTWLVLESLQSKYVIAPVGVKTEQSGLVRLDISGPVVPKNVGTSGLITFNLES